MAEHKAADFFARRKAEKDAERERQRKREVQKRKHMGIEGNNNGKDETVAAFFRGTASLNATDIGEREKIKSSYNGVSASELMSSLKSFPRKRASAVAASAVLPIAPRFPVPNHVMGGLSREQTTAGVRTCLFSNGKCGSAESWQKLLRKLRKAEKPPSYSPLCMVDDVEVIHEEVSPDKVNEKEFSSLLQLNRGQSNQQLMTNMTEGNDLYRALSSVLIPPAVEIADSGSSGSDSIGGGNRLWCDKYSIQHIPQDVCGDENKATAEKLVSFINEWRDHRNQALQRRVKEGKASSKKGSRRSQREREYYTWDDPDDDFFTDTDEEDGLCSVFVVTGPTGSGKTSLVHAAAKQCECIALEINTTEKRGGQALKRAIQESTQSHSSVALLKRENSTFSADDGGVNNDTDRCDHDGYEDEDESEDDGEKGCGRRKGSSLALVLIDEVDNLFENNGDAGFWASLGQLTKKAKCPIIITATTIPQPLHESATIRFECASLVRPTPMECALKMWHVANTEGMQWRKAPSSNKNAKDVDGVDNAKRGLCHVAKLCRCDLRRIMNEMQSFSHASVSALERNLHCADDPCQNEKRCIDYNMHLKIPRISHISPRVIPSSSLSLITIRGTNFQKAVDQFQKCIKTSNSEERGDGVKLEVKIGGRLCPTHEVIDDNTIIAVCPMSRVPPGVNSSGVFEHTFEDCLTCRYEPVCIGVKGTGSIVVQSSAPISEVCSHFNAPSADGLRIWNVEYDFPSMECELEMLSGRRKREERKRKLGHISSQEENRMYSSSSDDDFMSPIKRKCQAVDEVAPEVDKEVIGVDDERTKTDSGNFVIADIKASKNDASPKLLEEINLKNLLRKGVEDYISNQQCLSSKSSSTHNVLSAELELENVQSSCVGQTRNSFCSADMDLIANQMEFDSDAALLEDSFCDSAPLLAGPVSGFGYDTIEESAALSHGKLARNGNAKPPSIEKLYSSGWNDSGFFFGKSNTYMTHPHRLRDKRIFSRAEVHTRGMSRSTSDCSCPTPPTEVNAISSVMETSDMSHDAGTVPAEEDMFFPPNIPHSLTSLPRMIRSSFVGSTVPSMAQHTSSDMFLFKQSKEKQASRIFQLAFPIMPEGSKMNTFSVGIAYDKDCLDSTNYAVSSRVQSGDVFDSRFFLDYIPILRSMAATEVIAEKRYYENMKDTDDSNCSSSRRSSRRRNRGGRKHYFEKLISGSRQELLDKKTGAHLARMILSYYQSHSLR
uniref:AAA+ ATPase domain-containing protein n=1 Tax=Ditylum brightwellii TaxID=49249 RepID=A0A7S1ZDJ0_9STRA